MTERTTKQAEEPRIRLRQLSEVSWQPAGDEGVYFAGLHQTGPGAGTAFFRWEEGARSTRHNHPGGEELFMVQGRLRVGDHTLEEGDYLYTPPGGVHDAMAVTEAVALITLPGGIEFLHG